MVHALENAAQSDPATQVMLPRLSRKSQKEDEGGLFKLLASRCHKIAKDFIPGHMFAFGPSRCSPVSLQSEELRASSSMLIPPFRMATRARPRVFRGIQWHPGNG